MISEKKKINDESWGETQTFPEMMETSAALSAELRAFEVPETKPLQRRLLAGEMFKGEAGAYLRQDSLTADNGAKLIPSLEDHQEKLYELQRKEQVFIAKVNSKLPKRAQVIPYAMIPFQCWTEGPHANFLYNYLEFYPNLYLH